MDWVDLYDEEIAASGKAWQRISAQFVGKTLSEKVLDEMKLRVHDEFLKIGLIARVDVPTYVVEGSDNEPIYGQPVIEIMGRIPTSKLASSEEGVQTMDHERHRDEILKAKDRGEKFLGQKESARRVL